MIYVLCPYELVTGGPDALHQLVYYLNKNFINSEIVYCDIHNYDMKIPKVYQCYVNSYKLIKDILDSEENVVIMPETLWFYGSKFMKCKKILWWLSVDNNAKNSCLFLKLFLVFKKVFSRRFWKVLIKKENKFKYLTNFLKNKKYNFNNDFFDMHLCASYYAFDYVSSKTKKNCQILIEPISLFFLENYNLKNNGKRENIVLFNPRKNYSFTKQIISFAKRKKYPIVFMPLKGYSQDELTKLYSKAKLYIDFGSFPGAERIPKEAVINGCNILTGTNGASGFYGDVPIDNEFKIKSIKSNIKIIVDRIDFMLNNYENLYNRFDTYRKQVLGLEANFEKQLIRLFCENHLRSN